MPFMGTKPWLPMVKARTMEDNPKQRARLALLVVERLHLNVKCQVRLPAGLGPIPHLLSTGPRKCQFPFTSLRGNTRKFYSDKLFLQIFFLYLKT